MVGIEGDVVVDRVPLDEVLEAGEPVADAVIAGGLGDLVVRPLRQANDVDGDEVLGSSLLLGVTPGTPPRSIGCVGSYGLVGTAAAV